MHVWSFSCHTQKVPSSDIYDRKAEYGKKSKLIHNQFKRLDCKNALQKDFVVISLAAIHD